MPSVLAALPAAALALLAAGARLAFRKATRREEPLTAASWRWLAVPAVALSGAAALCAAGLYTGGPGELAALCLAALLVGAAALLRGRLLSELRGRLGDARAEAALAALALLCGCVLGTLALEVPYSNDSQSLQLPLCLIEVALVLLAEAFLWLLAQRRGAGPALGALACFVVGLAQFFLVSFRSSAILPNDVLALGTAVNVSGSYVYAVDGRVLLGASCALLSAALCVPVEPRPLPSRPPSAHPRARRALSNLAGAALVLAALVAGVTVPSYFDDLGVGIDYWFTLDYYRRQGLVTTFVAVAQDMVVDVPEGYSEASARATEESLARAYDQTVGADGARRAASDQYAQQQPTVIAIMNETFSDLSIYDGSSWGYDGPAFYSSMDDTISGGSLAVSVLGGGTCNSEFEFLTGISLANVGAGKYPYQLYDLSEAPSLARQLSELGYGTTAMHPNEASNWSRDEVYVELGFDRFLSIEDFEGDDYYHSGITDEATYDKILELLAEDEGPQFIFDVTMQNHSGYDQNNIPAEDLGGYSIDGFGDYDNGQLNEYLACIEKSDRALEEFLAELSELDRPVVVVFFGDHQPYLSTALNGTLYPDEEADSLEHLLRAYQTTYFIWANYDVAGVAQQGEKDEASIAYLAAMALDAAGVPLTDYQKAQLVIREEMPSVSLVGWQDAGRAWHETDETSAQESQAFADLSQIAYLEFASKLE